ncbi:MAG TPA: DUF2997 domain-containing protein [Bellilinea sp.]|jgi:hypothetical protein|nr:DUF2997 domain-containing protein [Bellilinea sp.]
MNLEELEITIDKDGQVSVHVHGVKGQACLDLTKSLEDALGGEVILREMTPEALENQNPDWLGNNLEIKRRA